MPDILTRQEMELLVNGWGQAYAARMAALALAFLLFRHIWKSWRARHGGMPWMLTTSAVGAMALTFSLIPQKVVNFVVSIEYFTRMRLIAIGISILVLSITFESIRKNRLAERYALLWITTALAMILAALFPRAVALLRAVTGMSYPAAMLSGVFVFLLLILFHFSATFSILRGQIRDLTQKIALIESRLDSFGKSSRPDTEPTAKNTREKESAT